MNIPDKTQLEKIYGETRQSGKRFIRLSEDFFRTYRQETAFYFTAPGRMELIGNHTDHNGGKVIAAGIDMDTVGAACPNDSGLVRITSEGYPEEIAINLSRPGQYAASSTAALVAGILEGTQKYGYRVSGFCAYVTSNVIAAAGVSSSASFEMLLCAMINYFFNDNRMSYADYAKIGSYAENVYWKKASGMMDQMACAVGGTVLFDFSDPGAPSYEPLPFSFQDFHYQPIIVNTGKGHADLSREYSEIPEEMRLAASAANAALLCETTRDRVLSHCNRIKNDRAILRALHFFAENERVERAAAAMKARDCAAVLSLIEKSSNSSWEYLQNCYSPQNCLEQKVPLTLALSRLFLENIQTGACRVHGGGFAGVILCIVPSEEAQNYSARLSEYVGSKNIYPLRIRQTGAVNIPSPLPRG